MFLIALAALCCAVIAGAVSAGPVAKQRGSIFYVSPSGSNSNPGTLRRPWRSPQYAIDRMAPGDTTLVLAGRYSGPIVCGRRDGGSAGRGYVSLRAAPGSRPVITGTSGAIVELECDYFELQGFDIAGPSQVGGTNVYPVGGSAHNRLIRNWIHGSICQGVSMDPSSKDYVIERNRIYDNGTQSTHCDEQAHGLYVQGTGHTVRNNLVYGNNNYGIQVYPSGSHNLIAFNTIVGNGVRTGKSGMVMGGSRSMVGNRIVSNVIAFNGAYGVHVFEANGSCDIHGNLMFGNPEGDVERGFPSGCVGRNLHGNPRFADRRGDDFHALAGSPAINAGDSRFAPRVDFGGRARGARPDIGAFESGRSSPGGGKSSPANVARPVLRGVAKRGHRLTTSTGAWSGARPMRITVEWRRCGRLGHGCATVRGATGRTLRLKRKDVGHRLFAVVTARNAKGRASARTGLSAVVSR